MKKINTMLQNEKVLGTIVIGGILFIVSMIMLLTRGV
jgi:hypothetical protein